MSRFRKRPVEIKAFQWFPEMGEVGGVQRFGGGSFPPDAPVWYAVFTLAGIMRIGPGDWVITGVAGELYPCKSAIFAQTYEALE